MFRIAFCEANRELVFRNSLQRYGIDVYAPVSKIQVRRRGKRRKHIIERAVFPHYVFTRMHESLCELVRVTPGFIRWLSYGDEIAMLEDDEILGLLEREASGEFDRISKASHLVFAAGTSVRVVAGPLIGFFGVVRRAPKRGDVAKVEISGKIFDCPIALLAVAIKE